jgi:hypothetical protein
MDLLERIGVKKDAAIEAQRIACLPASELEAFWAEKRESPEAARPR